MKIKAQIKLKFISFESLKPLFEIIETQKHFHIQIITTESFTTFQDQFSNHQIPYHLTFTSNLTLKLKQINLIVEDTPFSGEHIAHKTLLFSNTPNYNFIQLPFVITQEEKEKYFKIKHGSSFLAKAYGSSRSLADIEKEVFKIQRPTGVLCDYLESLILFILLRTNTFKGVVEGVKQADERFTNSFIIGIWINNMIDKGIISRRGDKYSIEVSMDSVKEVCKRIGYDVNRL